MAETYQEVVFWLLVGAMGLAAMRMVTTNNIVHAALYLVVTLMGAAGMYMLLMAEFVAWVQVLVYVGAVVVLMLFGVMLTRAPIGPGNYDNDQKLLALITAVAVFGVTSFVLVEAFEGKEIDFATQEAPAAEELGEVIFSEYVLPFEAVSVLLLAALIGAVVIARRDDDEERRRRIEERTATLREGDR